MPPCFHTLHLHWILFTCHSIDVQIEEPYWSQWQRLGVVAAVCCTNFWDCGDVVSCVTGHAVTLSQPDNNTATAWECFLSPLQNQKCEMKKIKRADEVWSTCSAGFFMLFSILLSKRLKVAFKSKTDKWLCKVTV